MAVNVIELLKDIAGFGSSEEKRRTQHRGYIEKCEYFKDGLVKIVNDIDSPECDLDKTKKHVKSLAQVVCSLCVINKSILNELVRSVTKKATLFITVVALSLILTLAGLGIWWFSIPRSFDDCIIKYLSGTGKNRDAVYLIEEACRSKFPEKKKR